MDLQRGILSRKQALESGLRPDTIYRMVRSGRWRSLQRGVYSVYTGDPPREAQFWVALRRAGSGAVLSHQSAAELFKLTDRQSALIHVTVPADRHVGAIAGLVVHRSTRLAQARHPSLMPPRTRLEETVLDLVQQSATFDVAFNAACAACQRRLTTPDRLAEAMGFRNRMRWRTEMIDALRDIGAGAHSMLEYRYIRRVERPHGLPSATRQARIRSDGRTRFLDNLYDEYRLCVELDGKEAHPDDQRWQDIRRANAVIAAGLTVLRYGWTDVDRRPCQTAAQVGAVLSRLGWPGSLKPCGPSCPIRARPGSP